MKGIIPTGGRGTRMRPVTYSANKHFIPVGNKPLIFYPLETVITAGIKEIAFTYNPGFLDLVKSFLGDGSKWSAKFTYVLQPEPKGIANIVQVCEEYLAGDPFLFHLGDNIFTEGVKPLVDHYHKYKPNGLLAVIHHPENERLGVPYYDKKGRLIKLVEKPKNPPHDLAIPGVYIADSNFFKMFHASDHLKPSPRGEYEIPDAYQWLIDHDYKVDTAELTGKWLDPGKFDDWLETNRYLLDHNVSEPNKKNTWEGVKIEGRVEIGSGCTLKNSKLRGPISIGNNTTIIDSFIGPFTSIYHGAKIENCNIENSVLMESVVLQNIAQPINSSIFGSNASIKGSKHHHYQSQFFVGEQSQITV